MNSANPLQNSWVTEDGSPWWLRDSSYGEPNGDYHANCYMDLTTDPANFNEIAFKLPRPVLFNNNTVAFVLKRWTMIQSGTDISFIWSCFCIKSVGQWYWTMDDGAKWDQYKFRAKCGQYKLRVPSGMVETVWLIIHRVCYNMFAE